MKCVIKRIELFLICISVLLLSAGNDNPSGKNDFPDISSALISDCFREAIGAGIAREDLVMKADEPISAAELIEMLQNALNFQGRPETNRYLLTFSSSHYDDSEVTRYQLSRLLFGIAQEIYAGHDFKVSGTAIRYEKGGTYRPFYIWDCPDYADIEQVSRYDNEPCAYAISAFDRITGDKLMPLYDDWSFRPGETVTVEAAAETALHFARSFEKDPIYVTAADSRAALHTIDSALYTGESLLPDASNQDLPEWHGFNIGFNSMFPGALCGNPDDVIKEGDLDYIRELGADYVHLYLSWSYFQGPDYTCDSRINLSRLEQLDEIISWCIARDIHIQLVFNDVPNLDLNNMDIEEWFDLCNTVFTDETVRDNVTEFWRMLARRYSDIPNRFLSFNLMNECDPVDDEQYVWGLGDAVKAILEETPNRVIVADVHSNSDKLTGAGMAELGCALSYHYYNLQRISAVSRETEAEFPGFYERIQGTPCYVNAHLYGPDYWDMDLPPEAKGSLVFSGAVGGAALSVTIADISWFGSTLKISAGDQTLYEGMEPYTYDEAADYIMVNRTVKVNIPEYAGSFSLACSEGSAVNLSDISLTLQDGTKIPMLMINDGWFGTKMAEVTIFEDGSFSSTMCLEDIKQRGQSLSDLIAVGNQYGVDVMVGECGFFESGDMMDTGIRQDAVEQLLLEQFQTFDRLGLAWCCEYTGRYAPVTPAPYLAGIEYRSLQNSPYYANLEMDDFFKEVFRQ